MRQFSLQRAYRNALAAIVLAQPLLLLLSWTSAPAAAVFMAGATAVIGIFTVLASVLYYDR